MVESELQREKREKDFQKRVLQALEKPTRGRISAIINSGFFLWLMSAVFLALGGSFFTNHQQCMRDAELLIDRHEHLRVEMRYRNAMEVNERAEAKSAYSEEDLHDKGRHFDDLKKSEDKDVALELQRVTDRIDYEDAPQNANKIAAIQANQRYVFSRYMIFSPVPENEHHYAIFLKPYYQFQWILYKYGYTYQPSCSPKSLVEIALGYRPKIISATPDHRVANIVDGTIDKMANMVSRVMEIDPLDVYRASKQEAEKSNSP
jgi:hypothetical protein